MNPSIIKQIGLIRLVQVGLGNYRIEEESPDAMGKDTWKLYPINPWPFIKSRRSSDPRGLMGFMNWIPKPIIGSVMYVEVLPDQWIVFQGTYRNTTKLVWDAQVFKKSTMNYMYFREQEFGYTFWEHVQDPHQYLGLAFMAQVLSGELRYHTSPPWEVGGKEICIPVGPPREHSSLEMSRDSL